MKKKIFITAFIALFSLCLHAQIYDIVVAKDGSGNYTSIQAAINSVPSNSTTRTTIYIKSGLYNTEKLIVPVDKQNVTLLGESRTATIISYHIYDCSGGKCPAADAALWSSEITATSATFTVIGNGFKAENITFQNTAGAVGQAQALTIRGDKTVFLNCDIKGYQDTIWFWNNGKRAYFKGCLILGRTDYIYGGGIGFFDQCEIRSWGGGWITAPSTIETQKYGFVFYKCNVTYVNGSPRTGDDGAKVALGRPWHNYPKVTWIYSDMTDMINPLGWPTIWNMSYAATSNKLELFEYLNTGVGANMSGRSKWAGIRKLEPSEVSLYERVTVLAGSDNWDPVSTISKQDAGSSVQSINLGSPLVSFNYKWTNAVSVKITGLPAGIKTTIDETNKTVTFTGTPIVDGVFVYTISTIGGFTTASHSGKITVIDNSAKIPSFPGAEGFGRYTTGGRGGKIFYVTNLNDSGTGSLRAAVEASGSRIVLFKVSGTIALAKDLRITNGDITIAGQTAPGDGICLKNYSLYVGANNIIIRYIRSRMGNALLNESDAMWGRNTSNIIIDHCSLSWSVDETGSFYDNSNFTLQWCILSESLKNSGHPKGAHGYGGIWGGQKASFHHNLIAHHDSRNPRLLGAKFTNKPEEALLDMRNNIIYNWGSNSTYGGEGGSFNIVNNYYKPGPATKSGVTTRIFSPNAQAADTASLLPEGTWGLFYINGNYMNNSTTVTNDNWKGVFPQPSTKGKSELQSTSAFSYGAVTTHSATTAFTQVLAYAGASLKRDAVDNRVVNETKNGTYTYTGSNGSINGIIDSQNDVGGWPAYNSTTAPIDTDGDGMPNTWETANGLNANDISDGPAYTLNSIYTNVEVYLNSLVSSITTSQNQNGVANYTDPSSSQTNTQRFAQKTLTNNDEQNQSVKIYPVPFQDYFFIDLGEKKNVTQVAVYNTLGQLISMVNENEISYPILKISVNVNSNTMLFVKITTSEEVINKTIMNKL